jgi:hypothetical protein
MKTRIDDLPLVRVSALVANGYIRRGDATALVRFDDNGFQYGVGVRARHLRNGGFWAMLVCPRCGGGAQRLRLLDGKPACGKCVRASGLRYRSESISTEVRHLATAPPRIARLNSATPARLFPRPGRMLDRRANSSSRCGVRGSSLVSISSIAPRISSHAVAGHRRAFGCR